MQPNTQDSVPFVKEHPNGTIAVHSMFTTIQGEGPHYGLPCVFIRLWGCNLKCKFCDTDYTSTLDDLHPDDILAKVRELRPSGLIVFSGGEPLRQPIGPLCELLLDNGYDIQIETNGCFYRPELPYHRMMVVCSPKVPRIHPGLMPHITALKYVVEHGKVAKDGLPEMVLGSFKPGRPNQHFNGDVWVQPMDSQEPQANTLNTEAAIESVATHGYRLCLQLHKFVGLP